MSGIEKLRNAIAKMKTVGIINKNGLRAVQSSYWPEIFHEGHPPGHGRSGSVKYLDESQRQKHIATFNGINLVIKPTAVFQIGISKSTKGEVIYVVDDNGKFYVGMKDLGSFHHSSFLAGHAVRGAGTMIIKEDFEVAEINNNSGHYCPSVPQMFRVALAIKLNGGDLDRIKFKVNGGVGQESVIFEGSGMEFLHAVRDGDVAV